MDILFIATKPGERKFETWLPASAAKVQRFRSVSDLDAKRATYEKAGWTVTVKTSSRLP